MKTLNFSEARDKSKEDIGRFQAWDFDRFTDDDVQHQYERPALNYDLETVKENISRLPEEERVIIDMYMYQKMTQKTIAKTLGMTQGGVSHRLKKAVKRMEFFMLYKELSPEKVERDLADLFGRIDRTLFLLMMKTGSITETVKLLPDYFPEHYFSFSTVRYAWNQMAAKMRKSGHALYEPYLEIINSIAKYQWLFKSHYNSAGAPSMAYHNIRVPGVPSNVPVILRALRPE